MKEFKAPARSRSTLSDVAQMAGVSESTVSLVLTGKGAGRRISEQTDLKVRSAARTLGYTPSLLHRSMKRGRTHVISLYNAFRDRDRNDLYMNRLSAAISHAGGTLGYDVLVHSNFQRSTKETYEFINGGFTDGLVLFGPGADEPLLPLLRDSHLPTVIIGPSREETLLSTVQDDEAGGMKMVFDAMIAAGHRRIAAIVEAPGGVLDPTGRVRRLWDLLIKGGLNPEDRNIIIWNNSARGAVEQLLALQPRPTAVFVWHDRTAYQVVEACEAMGLKIPQDLSIVGYDGIVWPSTSSHVISSVRVPLDEMADRSVSLLHRLIEAEGTSASVTLPVQFESGTTLGPALSV